MLRIVSSLLLIILFSGVNAAQIDDSLILEGAGGREMPVRVVYPDDAQSKATVVVSHGTFSSGKKYDPIATHWADNGYVVILPDHRDANYAETPSSIDAMLEIVDSRVVDLIAIADQLEVVESDLPQLREQIVGKPLISAGHSLGTQVAMYVAGLRIRDPRDGKIREYDESRYAAVVLLSDPGKMALMPADTWRGAAAPTFMITGPEDYGLMGDGRRVADYQNEILFPELESEPARYELLVDGLDHQFGGLVHKKVDAEPDYGALDVFNRLSTVFLARIADPALADSNVLESGKVSDRAELHAP